MSSQGSNFRWSMLFALWILLALVVFPANCQDEAEDITAHKIKKDKAGKRNKKVGHTTTTTPAPGSNLKTEDLIAESQKKPTKTEVTSIAQSSADGKMTVEIAKNLAGDEWHSYCGCGGDLCENYARCNLPKFYPLCCGNRCKCVKAESAFEFEDYWKTLKREIACKLKGCGSPPKVTCTDVTPLEFNCWTEYKNASENVLSNSIHLGSVSVTKQTHAETWGMRVTDLEPTVQFVYFGCE